MSEKSPTLRVAPNGEASLHWFGIATGIHWVMMRAFVFLLAGTAVCQVPPHGATPQIKKEWELGLRAAGDLERRDGRIADPAVIGYLQRLEKTIAGAAGVDGPEIRLTRSSEWYASRLPGGLLYISGGLVARIESEGEMAGLLAHDLAHARSGDHCVLASPPAPLGPEARESERRATAMAIGALKTAGNDPAALLDLLSKLAYEHPPWASAIRTEDLLALRAEIESEAVPNGGYRIDSSAFQKAHALVLSGMAAAKKTVDRDAKLSPAKRHKR